MVLINYGSSQEAWQGYEEYLKNLVLSPGTKRVCEIGGGANPSLPVSLTQEHGIEYTIADISQEELAKAPDGYIKIQGDISSPDLFLDGGYDLVFSRMVAEHLKNGKRFHGNVYAMLSNGGRAFHFFPTLYTLPSVINRLLPEAFSESLLNAFQEGRENSGNKGKFPAYYEWCRGPIRSQIKKFESLGFTVEEYRGFFGHVAYYRKFPALSILHEAFAGALVKYPIPWLTSFAYVVLRKR